MYFHEIDRFSGEGLFDELKNVPMEEFRAMNYSSEAIGMALKNGNCDILNYWSELNETYGIKLLLPTNSITFHYNCELWLMKLIIKSENDVEHSRLKLQPPDVEFKCFSSRDYMKLLSEALGVEYKLNWASFENENDYDCMMLRNWLRKLSNKSQQLKKGFIDSNIDINKLKFYLENGYEDVLRDHLPIPNYSPFRDYHVSFDEDGNFHFGNNNSETESQVFNTSENKVDFYNFYFDELLPRGLVVDFDTMINDFLLFDVKIIDENNFLTQFINHLDIYCENSKKKNILEMYIDRFQTIKFTDELFFQNLNVPGAVKKHTKNYFIIWFFEQVIELNRFKHSSKQVKIKFGVSHLDNSNFLSEIIRNHPDLISECCLQDIYYNLVYYTNCDLLRQLQLIKPVIEPNKLYIFILGMKKPEKLLEWFHESGYSYDESDDANKPDDIDGCPEYFFGNERGFKGYSLYLENLLENLTEYDCERVNLKLLIDSDVWDSLFEGEINMKLFMSLYAEGRIIGESACVKYYIIKHMFQFNHDYISNELVMDWIDFDLNEYEFSYNEIYQDALKLSIDLEITDDFIKYLLVNNFTHTLKLVEIHQRHQLNFYFDQNKLCEIICENRRLKPYLQFDTCFMGLCKFIFDRNSYKDATQLFIILAYQSSYSTNLINCFISLCERKVVTLDFDVILNSLFTSLNMITKEKTEETNIFNFTIDLLSKLKSRISVDTSLIDQNSISTEDYDLLRSYIQKNNS